MTGKDRQTAADVTLALTGDIENLFAVSVACGVQTDGAMYGVDVSADGMTIRNNVVSYYSEENVSPATLPDSDYTNVITDDSGENRITNNNGEDITYEI